MNLDAHCCMPLPFQNQGGGNMGPVAYLQVMEEPLCKLGGRAAKS